MTCRKRDHQTQRIAVNSVSSVQWGNVKTAREGARETRLTVLKEKCRKVL